MGYRLYCHQTYVHQYVTKLQLAPEQCINTMDKNKEHELDEKQVEKTEITNTHPNKQTRRHLCPLPW